MKKTMLILSLAMPIAVFAAPRTGPWTKEQAWEWYNAQPWIRGCNYMPASSPNRYDMWQVWDSDRRFEEMDRELALAESIGLNAVRVIIAEDNGFAVWCEDHDGYMRNLERFLALCGKHKIRAIMCLGNDCSRPKPLWSVPKPGPQPYDIGYHGGRKRSQHGSFPGMIGFVSADDPELRPKFFQMCGEVMEKYKDDDRVLFWNIWNEPGNNGRGKVTAPLIKEMFELAWKIGVKHPCAADLWRGKLEPNMETAEGIAAAWSDIISYHCYAPLKSQVKYAKELKAKFGRPMINTEWLARIRGCDVQDCYPFFAQERIGCTCWGFVAGKYQTYEPWEGMWKQVEKGHRGYKMTKWFHDLFRPSLRPYDPEEIDIIKHVNAQMDAELKGESLRAKIAKKCKIERQDMWHGYRRTQFDFNGRKAWVVEPSIAPRKDVAWVWNMLWPDCNVERVQVVELLKRGYHYAHIDLFDTRMDDAGVAVAAEFQSFLVTELGFAPKANLIGISWGGFMAAQYAAAKSANVARIYFDNALLTFDGYTPPAKVGFGPWEKTVSAGGWRDDPRMPVNRAGEIAKAGIKVLLVYGTSDIAVKPALNSKAFLSKFKAAGGAATVLEHSEYGHHPHGVEPGEAKTVVDFFMTEAPDIKAQIAAERNGSTKVFEEALAATEAKVWQSADGKTLPYRLHVPAKPEPGRLYPLVVHMHGAGSWGTNNLDQIKTGGADFISWAKRHGEEYVFIAPQTPRRCKWVDTPWENTRSTMKETPTPSLRMAMEIIDDALARYPIDRNRVYLMGISMGGYAAWELLQRRPELFAAALPCCGGGDTAQAPRLTDISIWAFHGSNDKGVPVCRSRDMVAAIKAAGGKKILYREYKGLGHNVWTPTFSDDSVFKWLFSQKRQ